MRKSGRSLSAVLFSVVALLFTLTSSFAAPADLSQEQLDWIKQHPVHSYAPEADYGPFIYVDANGKPLGLSVDFLDLLSKKTGLQFQAQPAAPLSENLEKAKRREVDLITSLRPTPERAQYLDFTTPYVSIPAILALRPGQKGSLSDMKGRKIAVGKGYAVEGFVREKYKDVEWVSLPSDGEALQQMAAGKVDGAVLDAASLQFLLSQPGMPKAQAGAAIGFEYPLSFAYRKDKPELGEILRKGMQAISVAERDQLLQRWIPADSRQTGGSNPILPAGALLVTAGIALALLFRHRSGKQQGSA